jgi:hypothetical protein
MAVGYKRLCERVSRLFELAGKEPEAWYAWASGLALARGHAAELQASQPWSQGRGLPKRGENRTFPAAVPGRKGNTVQANCAKYAQLDRDQNVNGWIRYGPGR